MSSAAFDFRYLKAGIHEVEPYLLSKNLFWPLSSPPPAGEPQYPRLTLGGLLLSDARMRARYLHPSQTHDLESLESMLDHWRMTWRTSWERKAQREFKSRLRQWDLYLNELVYKPEVHIPYYDNEVRIRVLIELLLPEINLIEDEFTNKLLNLDGFLKSNLVPGEFIWEDELKSGFDNNVYWYLWGMPEIDQISV